MLMATNSRHKNEPSVSPSYPTEMTVKESATITVSHPGSIQTYNGYKLWSCCGLGPKSNGCRLIEKEEMRDHEETICIVE